MDKYKIQQKLAALWALFGGRPVNHISASLGLLLCGCILGLNAISLTDVEKVFMVKYYFHSYENCPTNGRL